MQWCGLKLFLLFRHPLKANVTTDAVVWIEIPGSSTLLCGSHVTTDAVVWIEIYAENKLIGAR